MAFGIEILNASGQRRIYDGVKPIKLYGAYTQSISVGAHYTGTITFIVPGFTPSSHHAHIRYEGVSNSVIPLTVSGSDGKVTVKLLNVNTSGPAYSIQVFLTVWVI